MGRFEKGHKKLGGRKPGSPNRKQQLVREILDARNFSLIDEILDRLHEVDEVTQLKTLIALAPYVYPRLNTMTIEGALPTESKQVIDAKKPFAQFCLDASYPPPFPKQEEMFEFGMREFDPRLLLGSRGYGKTDYVTILGTAYDVYLNGTETSNLIVSKSKTRNTAILQEIANALIANGVKLEKQNSGCIRVEGLLGKDHSVEVLSIKSSFRGRHPKRLIMDDPVTEEDTSEATRDLVKRKYDEAYKLCKNLLIIGQPAHAYDLYAELRPQLRKMEVPHGTIRELDADLEAMRLAGVSPASIEMSYHLRIPADGSMPFTGIKQIERIPKGESVAFIDPSHEGGDFTALSIFKAHFDNMAVHGRTWKMAWNHCFEEIVAELIKYNVKRVCFETNALGDQPVLMLRQKVPNGVGVIGRKSTNNKHSRIMAAGAYAPLLYLARTSDKVYSDQVVKYEYGVKHDDAPDSLATGLEWIGLIRGKI